MKKSWKFALIAVGAVLFAACTQQPPQPPMSDDTPGVVKCGIESCHGMDITCGANVPDVCTDEYQLGDFCREYATCEVVNGNCQFESTPTWEACRTCVEECAALPAEEAFACETQCRSEIL